MTATNLLLFTILLALPETKDFRNRAIFTLGCLAIMLLAMLKPALGACQ